MTSSIPLETTINGPVQQVFDIVAQVRFWPKWHVLTRSVPCQVQRVEPKRTWMLWPGPGQMVHAAERGCDRPLVPVAASLVPEVAIAVSNRRRTRVSGAPPGSRSNRLLTLPVPDRGSSTSAVSWSGVNAVFAGRSACCGPALVRSAGGDSLSGVCLIRDRGGCVLGAAEGDVDEQGAHDDGACPHGLLPAVDE